MSEEPGPGGAASMTTTEQQPGAGQASAVLELQTDELRDLLEPTRIPWPVANSRQQMQSVANDTALDLIERVLDQWNDEEEGKRDLLRECRAKQSELVGALSVLFPGIVKQLAARGTLISEDFAWLTRMRASYEADEARDDLLSNLATFNAIAAGEIPLE